MTENQKDVDAMLDRLLEGKSPEEVNGSVWLPAARSGMWHELAEAIEVLPPARGSPMAHTRSAA